MKKLITSTTKDKAILKIMEDFESLSQLTLQQLKLLSKLLSLEKIQGTDARLNQLNKNEKKLDNYEIKISNRIISTIVLHKPVASELRNIMACYRMITNLERMGDLVLKVVNVLQNLKDTNLLLLNVGDVNKMLAITTEMVSKAIFSFIGHDKEAAMWTIENDKIVDEMNREILKKILHEDKFPGGLQKGILSFIGIKTIISSIERIADHAAHIAEASIYAYEGTDIRHTDVKSD
ncbi:MAG: phosphate uptake regulator PhoU [Peptostreptococcaceae bacterium]|nr:phosphate uptake regulator PhoU [Peptostreptococcaceae bacterium]